MTIRSAHLQPTQRIRRAHRAGGWIEKDGTGIERDGTGIEKDGTGISKILPGSSAA
jgi:hypothetical protein